MQPSHSQQTALDKEDAKIRMRREANENRARRFIDARTRTIGVDIEGLNQQVEEKRISRNNDTEQNRLNNIRAKEIDRVLEQSVAEEKNMRQQAMFDVKKSWEEHKYEKSGRKEEPDYRPEQFGASSMQIFAGEDTRLGERSAAKKEQMRRWTQEKVAEVAARKMTDKEYEMACSDMAAAIDEVRLHTELEEKDLRRAMTGNVSEYNRGAAADKARLIFDEKEDNRINGHCTSLHIAQDDEADTGVRRKDMFHGFTPAQLRRILQDNESIRQLKIAHDAKDKADSDEWAYSQALQQRAMEQAHAEEDNLRKQNLLDHQDGINRQREEQRYVNEQREIDKRGEITPEFFNKFGQSCR